MNGIIEETLSALTQSGNLRHIPEDFDSGKILDFSSNDYLGLSRHTDLQRGLFEELADAASWVLGASASRLLAGRQKAFTELEKLLSDAYDDGRRALLFNSGYHANTGLIPALAYKGIYIIADKLVHASIIDGIKLSGAPFARFRHNDYAHLVGIVEKVVGQGFIPMVVVESVYSMDGDYADMNVLAEIKKRWPDLILYVDEAHAIGVEGRQGLGLSCELPGVKADVIVGTFGKTLASCGAYAITTPVVREFLINKTRSLIFSTALPPVCALWSKISFRKAMAMDAERAHLKKLGNRLASYLNTEEGSHIQAFVLGDPKKTVEVSAKLRKQDMVVLPIRTPTVPPGTERLRISLSAAMSEADIDRLGSALTTMIDNAKQ